MRQLLLSLILVASLTYLLPAQAQEDAKKEAKDDPPRAAKKEEPVPTPKKEPFVPDEPLAIHEGHTDWIRALAFNKDGSELASASRDRTVRFWTKDKSESSPIHPSDVRGLAFLAPATFVTSTGAWNKDKKAFAAEIRLFRDHQKFQSFFGHAAAITCLTASESKLLATGSEDQTIKLWDAATGKELHTLSGHKGAINALAFGLNGKLLASAAEDGLIKTWDIAEGKELTSFKPGDRSALGLAFIKDGRLASAGLDGTLRVWNLTERKIDYERKAHEGIVALAVSPDGAKLATAGWDQCIKLWSADQGDELFTIKAHDAPGSALAFSPDGQTIASGSLDKLVKVWSALKAPEKKK